MTWCSLTKLCRYLLQGHPTLPTSRWLSNFAEQFFIPQPPGCNQGRWRPCYTDSFSTTQGNTTEGRNAIQVSHIALGSTRLLKLSSLVPTPAIASVPRGPHYPTGTSASRPRTPRCISVSNCALEHECIVGAVGASLPRLRSHRKDLQCSFRNLVMCLVTDHSGSR